MFYQSHNSVGQYYFQLIRYHNFYWQTHMHRHLELIYVREGAVVVETPGQQETIRRGEYAWIPSNCIHAYHTPETSVVDVCIFSEDFTPAFAKAIRGKKPTCTHFICRPSVSDFVCRELFVPEQIPDFFILKGALYAVMDEVIHQIPFQSVTAKSELLLDRIISYVAENYRENITLSSAAQALGYEEHYLSRCFHSYLPMHFSQYVNLYRVDAATELLQHSDLSITEIATQSGFQSIRSFNRVFLEITGKKPSQFFQENSTKPSKISPA